VSKIREHFVSRYGDEGFIMEFDYSQLEVSCLAYLSQDKQLIADIEKGLDLHTVSAAQWLHKDPKAVTQRERKKAKAMTFQLQYGAGYKSMAQKLKLSERETKDFINAYYTRYAEVKKWQEKNIEKVKLRRFLTDDRTPSGMPVGKSYLANPTGRRLTFKERESTSWKGIVETKFWDTEIKNYPVQSIAADIVSHTLGKVFRAIKNDERYKDAPVKMIMTVHDSIVFDVGNSKVGDMLYKTVMNIMTNIVDIMNRDFNLHLNPINVPIRADCTHGSNWMDMKTY